MGKWISRVIDKDYSKGVNFQDIPENSTDRTDTMQMSGSNSFTPSLDLLTESEKAAYSELVEFITSPQIGLSQEFAEAEALRIVTKNCREFQSRQATEDYKENGYLKIFSAVLNKHIYLVKDKNVKIPDQLIPSFDEVEVKALKGLDNSEIKTLVDAKILFGGAIEVKE